MEGEKKCSIGTQNIDLDALRLLDDAALTKLLESIFYDGYQQATKKNENKVSGTTEEPKALPELKLEENSAAKAVENTVVEQTEGKIEINISLDTGSQDPLEQRMKEISEMVYKFKNPGFVLYRMNGTEEEYLSGKYQFTTLPMKALVFPEEQDALIHKEMYWGTAEELQVKKV